VMPAIRVNRLTATLSRGPQLVLLALLALPLIAVACLALAAPAGRFAGLWGAAKTWRLAGETLGLCVRAAAIAMVIAVPAAWALARLPGPAAVVGIAVGLMPILLPSGLLATAWIAILGRQGLLTAWINPGASDIYTAWGAAMAMAWRYYGLGVLVVCVHLLRQRGQWPSRNAFALARRDRWLHLTWRPALLPTVAGWAGIFLLCLNDHVLPDLLLVSTLGTQMTVLQSAMMDSSGAAALGIPPAVVAMGLFLLGLQAVRPLRDSGTSALVAPGRPCWLAALPAAVMLLPPVLVPAAVLAANIASPGELLTVLCDSRGQVWQSLTAGGLASVLAVAAGTVLARAWRRDGQNGQASLAPVTLILLALPPSLVGIGIIELFNHWPLYLARTTQVGMVFGYFVRLTPLAMLTVYSLWPRELHLAERAAWVCRVPRLQAWTQIYWPGYRLALAVAMLLCLAITITDLELSVLLAPPGGATLGVRLATMMHTASQAMVSALALDLLLIVTPLLLAVTTLLGVRLGRED